MAERSKRPGAETNARNDDKLDSDDEAEIQEWNLRFLFEEYRFGGPVWEGLQAAGWTYAPVPEYTSPGDPPMTFPDGKAICAYLDKFCIAPIFNTLQLPPDNPLTGMTPEEIQRGEELRRDVVRQVYKKMSAIKGGRKNKQNDTDEDNHEASADREGATQTSRRRHSSRLEKQSHIASSSKSAAEEADAATKRPSRPRRAAATRSSSKTTATAFEKGADTFFRKSRQTKSTTVSSQDIAFLKFPSVTECIEQFRGDENDESVHDEMEAQHQEQDFDDWKFLLTTQHSLLLYGFGSKRKLLESFARNKLEEDGDVLTIDGFDRDVRVESILDLTVDHFLNGNEPSDKESDCHPVPYRLGVTDSSMIGTHNVVERAARIARALAVQQKRRGRPLYLVIHNIDGPNLCSRDIQQALAVFVSHSVIGNTNVRAVRLVASIDHINASALLWDNKTNSNFSWMYKEVHTYRPYIEELAVGVVDDDRKQRKSKKRKATDMQDATLWNVLASLAPRHAEVVKILATLQSEDLQPVDHAALLRNCKHKMTVTNDTTLRMYLTELRDHGIVESGKDTNTGKEWLRIPHSREKLLEIRDFEME